MSSSFAATVTWSGLGADDNWSTDSNWSGGTPPGNAIVFNDTDATGLYGPYGTPNNIVKTSCTVQSLKYGNTNGFHTTQIPLGITLTVTGSGTNLLVGTDTDNGASQTVYATFLGQGSLFLTNNSALLSIRQGSSSSGNHRATLDLEGLDTFTAYVSQVRVAGDNGSSGTGQYNREQGTLTLAKTNYLFCSGSPGLLVSENAANGGTSDVKLGQTNVIFCDAGITVGGRKSANSTLSFNPVFYLPTVLFRDRAGTGRQANWFIGDDIKQPSGNNGASGTIDFSYGSVDALVSTLTVGRGGGTGGTGTGTGTLTFNSGKIDVNALDIGVQPSGGGGGVGTVNVNGSALLIVNSLLRLAVGTASSGTLSISGGTVYANALTNGGGSAVAVSLVGGTLAVTNTAGSASAPIVNFSASDSHLQLAVNPGSPSIFVGTMTAYNYTNDTIDILSLPLITAYPAQFPLLSYTSYYPSTGSDFLLGTLPGGYRGYISNNTATSTLDLVVTGGPRPPEPLTWNGNLSADWNTTTANWLDLAGASTYSQNDFVTFDDTATGTTTVNLTGSLTPTSLTVSNNSKPYTFNGTGSLGGAAGLLKAGSAQLTLANTGANAFSGGVSILGGKLQLDVANVLPATTTVTLADDPTASLALNNVAQSLNSLSGGGPNGGNVTLGSGTLALSGSGTYAGILSGTGMLLKTNPIGAGGGTQVLSGANTYSGGTIIGGGANSTTLAVANPTGSGTGSGFVQVLTNGMLTFGNGGPGGSVAATTITNSGTVRLDRSDDFTFANTLVGSGALDKRNTNTVLIASANAFTGAANVNAGALRISHPDALGTADGWTWVGNDPTARLELFGGMTLAEPVSLSCKQTAAGNVPVLVNVSGSNSLTGPISLSTGGSFWTFEVDADKLTLSGPITNTTTSNTRTVRLRGVATGEIQSALANSPGNQSITALLKEETGTWTLSGTSSYTGPTTVNEGTLLVNGVLGTTAVAVNGGVLGGAGTLNGPVTIGPAGTLAPGPTLATLTVNNDLTLAGTNVMKVSHSGCDKLTGVGTLTLGGTLQVVVTGPLFGGEIFKLFTATTVSGDFALYELPALPSPLSWDTSSVPVDGTLKVLGSAQPPPPATLSSLTRSPSGLVLVWAGGTNQTCLLLSTTNLATPRAAWEVLGTNVVAADGLSTNALPINPAEPKRFYLLSLPYN